MRRLIALLWRPGRALLWWLTRHRLIRRLLVWFVVRLIRRHGWRRTLAMLVGGRRRWRFLALVAWRTAVMVLRASRFALRLTAPRAARRLGLGTHGGRGGMGGEGSRRSRDGRPWRRRVARRRDRIRRSLLAAAGVDPDWRPPSRRGIGAAHGAARTDRPELGTSDRGPTASG